MPKMIYAGDFPATSAEYYRLGRQGVRRLNYVYVLRDAFGDPVYVGMSRRPGNRFDRHRRRDWWHLVDSLELLEFEGESYRDAEQMARRHEADLIREMQPPANRMGVLV